MNSNNRYLYSFNLALFKACLLICLYLLCSFPFINNNEANAATVGAAIPVTTAAGTQDKPAVASNGINYLIVYQSGTTGVGTGIDIYGTILNSVGGVVVAPFAISTATGDQTRPSVAYNSGSANYLVAYQSSAGLNDTLANYVSTTGVVGTVINIAANATRREEAPSVAADGTNYFVAWVRAGTSIRVTSVSGTGGTVGGAANAITVGTVAGTACTAPCGLPSISFGAGTGRYLVAYENFTDINGDILANTITTAGVAGTALTVANTAVILNRYPSTAFSNLAGASGWLITWQDFRNSATTGNDIYGQLVNTAFALNGTNFIISNAGNHQYSPVVSHDGLNFFVAWRDMRLGAVNAEIYGTGISSAGTVLSTAGYAVAASTTYNKQNCSIIALAGDFLIVWGESRATWDIYGQIANQPGINNLGPVSGSAGSTVSVNGNKFGAVTDTLNFGGTPSATSSWADTVINFPVPNGRPAGNYAVDVTVSGWKSNSQTFSVLNSAPVANAGTNQSVNESTLATLNGSGSTDPNGDALTYSWTQTLGTVVTLSSSTAMMPTFTAPAVTSATLLTFQLVVNDGTLSSSPASVNVTVNNVNQPPVLNPIGAKAVNENINLNFTISGSDPDGDPITFSATGLPAGATFNTSTQVFDWTPSYSQSGSYNVTFTVSDGSLSASEVVTITVTNVNRAPVLNAIGAKNVNEAANLNFTISGSDPDGDAVTYSASGLPVGATFNTATRVFDWTPTYSQSGSYNVIFSVSDGSLSASEVVTITVNNVNRAPVLNAIGAKNVNEAANLNFTISGSDPDADPLTYSASGLPVGATFNTATRVFDWTPTYSQSGSYNVTFSVSDGSLSASEVVTITVTNVNRAPVLNAIGAKNVNEAANLNFTISGSDPDGDPITYSATGLPAGASFNTSTQVFDWTPSYSQSGSYNVTFTVSDGSLSASEIVTITVTNVNRAPALNAIGAKGVNENANLNFTISGSDPDGDAVTYSATGLPSGAAFNTSTRVFDWTPSYSQSGSYNVTFTISDGSLNASEVITITVNNVNQSPVLNAIGGKSIAEGSLLQFTVSASDPDGDATTLSATGVPSWAGFNTVTGLFSGTPGYGDSGSYNVTFTVSDGSLNASEVVTITVTNVNRAPVLNAIGAKGVNENANLNFTISGSDPDGDAVIYSASGLPAGTTFNTSTRVFDWTPTYSQSGSYNATFTISDGSLNVSEVVTITVSNVNRTPVLNAIGSKGANEGSNLNFTVSGSDPDGDALTYSATGLPVGAVFNTSTGIFDWTPDYTQSGSYNVTFTVSDGSLNASEVVVITVSNVNRAPALNAIGAKGVNENANLNFTISGSDPDGDAVTWSASGLPAGATFNTSTRVFDWTPSYSQSGSYNVTFTVSDGSLSASEVVTITVSNVNRAPALNAIGAKGVNENVNLNFTISGSDPDGDAVTWSASGLPAGATFNTSTRVFDWTPSYSQSGSYNVTFTVSDGSLSANEVVTITVSNVNRSPVLNSIGSKSVNENANLNFTISGSDPDGDAVTWSASGLPAGATFNTSTRVFDWTPSYSQSGSYNVTFTVNDGSLSVSEAVTITVNNVNRAPVLNPIGGKSIAEGNLLQFTVTASEPDGDSVTLSASNVPAWGVFNTSTGVFSGTPGIGSSGTYLVTFTASDGSLSSNEVVTITVANTNLPPVLNPIGAKGVNENSNLNFTITGSDPDSDPLTFSASGLPSGATFNISTQVFDWTPSYSQSGSYNVTFTVSDGSLSATEVVTITVSNVNRAPVLNAIGAKGVNENANLNFTISGSDPDGDAVTWSASGLPSGAAFNTSTGLFDWTPSYSQSGSYNVTFTISDGFLTSTEVVTITVSNVNRSPVLNAIGAKGVNENANLSFTISGSDPDGDAVTYSASGVPSGAAFNTSTGVFDWTPAYNQSGSYNVTFTISDGSLSANEVVTITVANVNRSPVLNAIGAKGVNENANLSFTISGSDPDGDAITFSATGLPSGAAFNTSTGVFGWTPAYSQSGSYNVTFTVSDGSLSASEVVAITVGNVNQPPVLNPIGNKSIAEGVLLQFNVTASDPDGDTLTLSATSVPAWAGFNTSTGLFSGTAGYTNAGTYNVTFTASDGSLTANETITITVTNVNRSPVLNTIGAKSVNENSNLNFTVNGSDPDGDALIYSASGLPSGATFNTTTRVFDWTPAYSQSGSYNVTFTVSDGSLSASEVVTVSVNNSNRAPVLTPVGNKNTQETTLLQFTVSASDPDGDAVTLSATGVPAWAGFNTTTGLFSGTPGYADSGAYTVTFTASDGSLSASETITITVTNVNRSPVLNPIGAKSVNETVNLNFAISGSDPDGDAVTYSASGLPTGATFNTSTQVFNWTPTYSQSGSYNVTFTVSDGSLSASEVVTIIVANVNQSPVLNPVGNKTISENALLQFTVTASDPDGGVVTLSSTAAPSWATLNSTTGVFSGTPGYSDSGTYSMTFTASDGSLTSSETISITVSNTNRPPVLNGIGAKSISEGSNLNFTISGSDPDTDPLTYSATGLPSGATFNSSTRVFDWTPAYNQSGSYNVIFTVSDGSLSAVEVVNITVNNVNLSPVLNAIGVKIVNEAAILNFTISGSDPDTDPLTYSAAGLPSGAAFNSSTRVFNWTPSYTQSGSYNVTFTVSDGALNSSEIVTITVANVNQAPSAFAGTDQSVAEGANVTLPGVGSDADGDTITYNWVQTSGIPVTINPSNAATSNFTAPFVSVDSTLTFQITVSDGSLNTVDSVNILVQNTNDADNDGYNNLLDCNDNDPLIHPGALELLDGVDNNCNGTVDEGFDNDGDGFTTLSGDCNNTDASIYPGAPELVDGKDNNCNSLIDDNTTPGLNVPVTADSSVNLTFSEVLTSGTTSVNTGTSGPVIPPGYRLPSTKTYYDIFTTSNFNGSPVTVCITYNEMAFTAIPILESSIRLFHWNGSQWQDITSAGFPDVTANKVCGVTLSFSPFVVAGEPTTSAGVFMGVDSYSSFMQEQNNSGNQAKQQETSADKSPDKKKVKVSVPGNINVTSTAPSDKTAGTSVTSKTSGASVIYMPVDVASKADVSQGGHENNAVVAVLENSEGRDYNVMHHPETQAEAQAGVTKNDRETFYNSYITDSPVNEEQSFRMTDGYGNEFSSRRLGNTQQDVRPLLTGNIEDGAVVLQWKFSGKAKGFFVLRADSEDRKFVRMQEARLPVLDSNGVYEYTFGDHSITENHTYYYRLEIVDQEGHVILTEPVSLANLLSAVSAIE